MRGEFLDVGGLRLYYYAAGTRGAGEPIVLVHGFAASGHLWTDVVPALPQGHRVVVLDCLGHGRSDPGRPDQLGVLAHADRLVAVLDELRIGRACLVGHGTGGAIAQALAIRAPLRVSRLCLVSSASFAAWPTRRGRLARRLATVARFAPAPWVVAAVRSELLRGFVDVERGARDLDVFLRPFADGAGRDQLLAHLIAVTDGSTLELAARTGEIKAPTAIVWGTQDAFLPEHYARTLAAAIPGSTLSVVDGVSHYLPAEGAHSVAVAVRDVLLRS